MIVHAPCFTLVKITDFTAFFNFLNTYRVFYGNLQFWGLATDFSKKPQKKATKSGRLSYLCRGLYSCQIKVSGCENSNLMFLLGLMSRLSTPGSVVPMRVSIFSLR